MGYWGTLVAVRATPDQVGELLDRPVSLRRERPSGWNVLDVQGDLTENGPDLLQQLSAELAEPLLAAAFFDSDYGRFIAIGRTTPPWGGWIDRKGARQTMRDHLEATGTARSEAARIAAEEVSGYGFPPRAAARAAVAWAAESGRHPRAGAVRRALATSTGAGDLVRMPWKRYVFAEELFDVLLDRLEL